MIFLGIDPGTATTGFGVIRYHQNTPQVLDYGCIKTASTLQLEERLQQIWNDLEEIIEKWKPQAAAVEEIFFSKNVKTAISVAHARGVILQKLYSKGISSTKYTPSQVKSSICGDGTADKKQIQKMLKIILSLKQEPKQDDASDALALALCHAYLHKQLTTLNAK